ncbi:single-stranded DNA-binding protein [Mucilaginibacter ginsenosidivorans]|uniref:Single-stranded DNA-binding protein n=1 Tax=Mucilaginibacter ginsenosidivorans TaxID=398053 RepID=A0A5B8USV1_9SPHI|nr:single-stranded DNA-binding protein [Mucilaginibacter ginsenosidivorans]QEC61958.1 single-stranded DNA-binding protein [Mucilaginibacter ginsenosidivorans]
MQQFTGRVTADAIVKTLDGGKEVVSFSIADNESYKPKGQDEPVQISTFFNCSYWAHTGVAKVLRKGAVVQVNGRVSARPYTTNTGDAAASLNVHANRIEVLAYATDKPDNAAKGKKNGKQNTPTGNSNDEVKDDLPF